MVPLTLRIERGVGMAEANPGGRTSVNRAPGMNLLSRRRVLGSLAAGSVGGVIVGACGKSAPTAAEKMPTVQPLVPNRLGGPAEPEEERPMPVASPYVDRHQWRHQVS